MYGEHNFEQISQLSQLYTGVEFRFGLRESKLILKFQLLHISMEKLILISGCYENHCENRFSDSRRISSPATDQTDSTQL